MDGRAGGWKGRRMGGQMDGRADGWEGRRMGGQKDGKIINGQVVNLSLPIKPGIAV